jgi:hypothetical protein
VAKKVDVKRLAALCRSRTPRPRSTPGRLSASSVASFAPLVANTGRGDGDQIYASPKLADGASFEADAKKLIDRGVVLTGLPTCT